MAGPPLVARQYTPRIRRLCGRPMPGTLFAVKADGSGLSYIGDFGPVDGFDDVTPLRAPASAGPSAITWAMVTPSGVGTIY